MGTVEERFFLVALDVLGVATDAPLRGAHKDRSLWPDLRVALTDAFATRTRDEWAAAFRDHDACVTPVLDLDEATRHEQAVARGAYQSMTGYDVPQPAVSPRFSRSDTPVPPPPGKVGEHTDAILAELGYAPERVASLRASGVVA
jgi:alpha-methylacyl-CoA racemase